MEELLLYIRLEDHVVINDEVAREILVADKNALVSLIRQAVSQHLVERWALADGPIDLDQGTLDGRALSLRLTENGMARVDALLELAHKSGQTDELDDATRRAMDSSRVDYATLMSQLTKS